MPPALRRPSVAVLRRPSAAVFRRPSAAVFRRPSAAVLRRCPVASGSSGGSSRGGSPSSTAWVYEYGYLVDSVLRVPLQILMVSRFSSECRLGEYSCAEG
eukprot:1553664-Alexandrium_andersonii.AAC.1